MDKDAEIIKKLKEAEQLLKEVKELLSEVEPEEKPKERLQVCNYCAFATCKGLPDGVICNEPHHIKAGAKERHQYYRGTCAFYQDDGVTNIYDL